MRIIKLNEKNEVIYERFGKEIKNGEIFSHEGSVGQIMLEDGTFIDPPNEYTKPEPSIEEQILFETQYQTLLLEMGMIL